VLSDHPYGGGDERNCEQDRRNFGTRSDHGPERASKIQLGVFAAGWNCLAR
jgi:hypothetical protein